MKAKFEKNLLLALDSPTLDTSDFILISTRIIENDLKNFSESNKKIIFEIRKQYMQQEYQLAIENIFKLINENKNLFNDNLIQKLSEISNNLKSSPKDNNSRRFYESLYAKALENKIANESYLLPFKELSYIFNKELKDIDHFSVTNLEDAKTLICSIHLLNDNIELGLKKLSKKYQRKDRDRNDLGEVMTANPGIMNPSAANFVDNLFDVSIKEKMGINETVEGGYSANNPSIPFVSSISGTAFTFAVLLEKYLKQQKNDKNIQDKVNTIINLFISTYIIKGFHSYSEIIDVFKEPCIQSIFEKNQIKLDYGVFDMPQVFHSAQDYAIKISQQSLLNATIKTNIKEIQPHIYKGFEINPSVLDGKFISFVEKPNKIYIKFTSDTEMNLALAYYNTIGITQTNNSELNSNGLSYRKASIKNTIEITPSCKNIINIKRNLFITEALTYGEKISFKGREKQIYLKFENEAQIKDALKMYTFLGLKEEALSLDSKPQEPLYRIAKHPNTIEVNAAAWNLIQSTMDKYITNKPSNSNSLHTFFGKNGGNPNQIIDQLPLSPKK